MTITIDKNEIFGWFVGENIDVVFNNYVEIYHDNQLILEGEFSSIIDILDEYYFYSIINKINKKGNILKFYLIH